MSKLVPLTCMVCLLAAGAGAATAADPRSGELILFWACRSKPCPAVWAMRPDGSHQRLIYGAYANAKRPTLSPDRAWVAFDGASPDGHSLSDFDIQIVRLDGTRRRTVVGSPAREIDAQWSPDGSRLSFSRQSRSGSSWVWIVRRDGSHLRRLARGELGRWSADGKKLVFAAPTREVGRALFVVNAEASGRRRRLSRTRGFDEFPAAWSPDGKKILFTRCCDRRGDADVFAMDADGTNVRRLTYAPGRDEAAAWSPDGSRILFTSERTGHPQAFVMQTDGSHQRNISRSASDDEATSWR